MLRLPVRFGRGNQVFVSCLDPPASREYAAARTMLEQWMERGEGGGMSRVPELRALDRQRPGMISALLPGRPPPCAACRRPTAKAAACRLQ